MVARVATVAFHGIRVVPVDVQVSIAGGVIGFPIVGLADKAVAESRERVRAALAAIGLALPPERITVNLAPADLAKEGTHYDLPIALGLLAEMRVITQAALAGYVALGELGLDGTLAPVPGVLPAAIQALGEKRGVICPAACGPEAAWAKGLDIVAPRDLLSLINHVKGVQRLAPPGPAPPLPEAALPDLADVKGQESAKRALEVAAAGGHHLLMVGPPGSGKSMLAARLPGLLPPLTAPEILEASMIASVAGLLREGRLAHRRPFRAPHHNASQAAMVGGGTRAKPGEITLAHLGTLFLDELPEFPRAVLEALRQPLETGEITVARANSHITYPARVQLVAAMNPCRCGHLGDPSRGCSRAPACGTDYQARISGPLLDRFDLRIDVPPVAPGDLALPPAAENSAAVAARVAAARARQAARYGEEARTNAAADGEVLMAAATPDPGGQALLTQAVEALKLSARGYHRVLRVARTIADLDASDTVRRPHVAEALAYRQPAGREVS
jgi:magnesium chelatase family protein